MVRDIKIWYNELMARAASTLERGHQMVFLRMDTDQREEKEKRQSERDGEMRSGRKENKQSKRREMERGREGENPDKRR